MPLRTLPFRTFLLLISGLVLLVPHKLMGARTLDRTAVEQRLASFHLVPASNIIRQLPSPAYRAFYQSNIWLYQYLATQEEAYSQAFSENWKETLEQIESLPKSDPLRDVMLAEVYGKRGALEFLNGNYLTALRLVRNARRIISKNAEKFPDNVEQLKLLGLFNVVFAAVPKKYHWLTHLLGYNGDMQEGMAQLEKAARQSSLMAMEATLIAYYAEKNILGRPDQAIERMEIQRAQLGGNILIDFMLASAYCGIHRNDEGLDILEKRALYAENSQVFFIPYWDYSMGKSYYYRGDYAQAQIYLSSFLESHKGNIYHTDATFRLAMALSLQGEDAAARQAFSNMLSLEPSPFDEDEYALHMAQRFSEEAPNEDLKQLFMARNLFDGGYLDKSLELLAGLREREASLSPEASTELFYRYGRVYHSQGRLDMATGQYQLCIDKPDSGQRWMQAYACYYLGEIARGKGDLEGARSRYKQAMTFDNYFYQGGLENRCKAALSEMKG